MQSIKTKQSFKVKRLENIFAVYPLPCSELKRSLAEELDMPLRSVQIWFQNRRARSKAKFQTKPTNQALQWTLPMTSTEETKPSDIASFLTPTAELSSFSTSSTPKCVSSDLGDYSSSTEEVKLPNITNKMAIDFLLQ